MSSAAPAVVPLLLLSSVLLCSVANAQAMLDPPPRVYVAPGRVFQMEVPPGWNISQQKGGVVQVTPSMGGDAYLWVRRLSVPRGASPRQLALNAIDRRLSKLPSFQVMQKRNIALAGTTATSVLGTYSHQGNIQFPRAIEEIFLVVETEAYILHFECFEPAAATYAPYLNRIYQSFLPRPPGIGSTPYATNPAGGQFPEIDKVEF